MKNNRYAWLPLLMSLSGLAAVGGCLARVQQNIELVLAPEATANLLRLTTSPLVGLSQLLARFL